ncbi:altronate dehydratase [Galbibacter orientalis DSM 19592]|uniref:Altronate dehydratase n=1 Tax=Galbibacter orientalis DSM 19592 TaxID=926559 RepID=I3CAW3_9FLAO|nr:altronate dehydratase family protein [Galbibacter orientalis]EIJ40756.1 altronate dehydratase [Galbibacter orientalis DSM 19592]
MQSSYVQIDPLDNIIVAITDLPAGTLVEINNQTITLKENIKQKHKFALNDLSIGANIFMYGVLVGVATQNIDSGSAITVSNIKHAAAGYNKQENSYQWNPPSVEKFKELTFDGYHRKDGKVGTANYWLVIPLVFCENRNVELLEASLNEALGYSDKKDISIDTTALIKKYQAGETETSIYETPILTTQKELKKNRVFKNVDGIKYLKHDGGCGGIRQDAEVLCNLLAGYIANANVAGATILSLGCQNAQMEILEKALEKISPKTKKTVHYLEQQQSRNEHSFIEEAVKLTFLGLIEANKVKREPAPLSKIKLGLECGGSDGFSGISANPALGYASDLLVALGGSPVLAEFPELNGVEQELINRCIREEDAQKFTKLMSSYSSAAVAVGSGFENNPSPGNIKDGLITDAMKSAGAAKKGGTSPIVEVLDYTEQVEKPGLNLLCTPGNDVESTTGLAGSGCNIIVFTTGLGTPTGNPITPILKLASNTTLAEKMDDIIDVNTGTIISGEDTIESMGEKILLKIIEVASGRIEVKAEINGNNDFIPWKRGISL